MRIKGLVALLFCLLGTTLPAIAGGPTAPENSPSPTPRPAWVLEVGVSRTTASGADLHAGDVFTLHDGISGNVEGYGVSYDPIVARMGKSRYPDFTLGYAGSRWGLRISNEDADFSGSTSGTVRSDPPIKGSVRFRGVRMWGQSLTPLTDQMDRSGFSPGPYAVSNALSAGITRLELTHRMGRDSFPRVDVIAGLVFVNFEKSRSEEVRQTANIAVPRDRPVNGIGPVVPPPGSFFHNDVSLRSVSSSRLRAFGPSFGVLMSRKLWGLQAEGLVRLSLLRGTTKRAGQWDDRDDISIFDPASGRMSEVHLAGQFPMASKTRSFVPGVEFGLNVALPLSDYLSLGAGLNAASWSVPMPSAWVVPGAWQGLGGSGWVDQKNADVLLVGGRAFIRVSI